jgi:hypothetical protein
MAYIMIDNLFVTEVLDHDEANELAKLVDDCLKDGKVDLKHPAFLVFMENFTSLKGDIVSYSMPFMIHASWLTTQYFQWYSKECVEFIETIRVS